MTNVIRTILFFHHSSDLYGSDRTLLSLVRCLDRSKYEPIVVLPRPGPLEVALRECDVSVELASLAVVERATGTARGLLDMPVVVQRSLRDVDRLVKSRPIDLVYSNTLAVLTGAVWARRNRVPHLWHVREIVQNPWFAKKGFAALLRRYGDYIVYNSHATEGAWYQCGARGRKDTTAIWNGIPDTVGCRSAVDASEFRTEHGVPGTAVVVTLVGRINRWKGQILLVEAFEEFADECDEVCLLLVGSHPEGQGHFLENLKARIARSPAKLRIFRLPYQSDVRSVWKASDIVVVPSTEPEPFGRVAVEAMMAAKPVVAAAHGGLTEIVDDGTTGLLFTPGDRMSLAQRLRRLVDDRALRVRMGEQGLQRARRLFTEDAFVASMHRFIGNIWGAP